jgi:hypothetical protein
MSVMEKYTRFILSENKEKKNNLNAVSGDSQGRRSHQEAARKVRKHKMDSLKKLHGY